MNDTKFVWDIEAPADVELLTAHEQRTVDHVNEIAERLDQAFREENRSEENRPIIVTGGSLFPWQGDIVHYLSNSNSLGELQVLSGRTNAGKSIVMQELIESYAQEHFDEYPMWSADSVLNKGPIGSSRKSNVHAKVKRKEQSNSRKLNRGKK
jgi:hypothetical protein